MTNNCPMGSNGPVQHNNKSYHENEPASSWCDLQARRFSRYLFHDHMRYEIARDDEALSAFDVVYRLPEDLAVAMAPILSEPPFLKVELEYSIRWPGKHFPYNDTIHLPKRKRHSLADIFLALACNKRRMAMCRVIDGIAAPDVWISASNTRLREEDFKDVPLSLASFFSYEDGFWNLTAPDGGLVQTVTPLGRLLRVLLDRRSNIVPPAQEDPPPGVYVPNWLRFPSDEEAHQASARAQRDFDALWSS